MKIWAALGMRAEINHISKTNHCVEPASDFLISLSPLDDEDERLTPYVAKGTSPSALVDSTSTTSLASLFPLDVSVDISLMRLTDSPSFSDGSTAFNPLLAFVEQCPTKDCQLSLTTCGEIAQEDSHEAAFVRDATGGESKSCPENMNCASPVEFRDGEGADHNHDLENHAYVLRQALGQLLFGRLKSDAVASVDMNRQTQSLFEAAPMLFCPKFTRVRLDYSNREHS